MSHSGALTTRDDRRRSKREIKEEEMNGQSDLDENKRKKA
jgi:hypothetical protein